MINKILNWLRPKSPCCKKPMKNTDCHDAFGDMPIYECPECKKEWIQQFLLFTACWIWIGFLRIEITGIMDNKETKLQTEVEFLQELKEYINSGIPKNDIKTLLNHRMKAVKSESISGVSESTPYWVVKYLDADGTENYTIIRCDGVSKCLGIFKEKHPNVDQCDVYLSEYSQ